MRERLRTFSWTFLLVIAVGIFTFNGYSTQIAECFVPAPSISETNPDHGAYLGGTEVLITGSNLFDGAMVLFGDKEAQDVVVSGGAQITCKTPPGIGSVSLRVINPDGQQASSQFFYNPPVDLLYIDDQGTAGAGDMVQFALALNRVSKIVWSFGLEVHFDPNVLTPAMDPNDPNIRGDLIKDYNYFNFNYTPGNDFLRIGGFAAKDTDAIHFDATGRIALMTFRIVKPYGTTSLSIVEVVDDLAGCIIRDGSLYGCPPEICDSADNDCDGLIDEGCANYYLDKDADGYGDAGQQVFSSVQLPGYRSLIGDCDPNDSEVYPGAQEQCDGKDNDCNGVIDDPNKILYFPAYRDRDKDGFGDPNDSVDTCKLDPDFVMDNTDCDDSDPNVNTNASEVCDGKDNNCDGLIDPEGTAGCNEFYRDGDNDGYGKNGDSLCLCEATGIYKVPVDGDCDDSDNGINPVGVEVCDGKDNNCDGLIDPEGTAGCNEFYRDGDNDGYGKNGDSLCLCEATGIYKVPVDGDCDDSDPDIYQGAQELCDGKDNDCDEGIDESGALNCTLYYRDEDGDGYGVADDFMCLCTPDGLYRGTERGDCDDSDPEINTGTQEVCDGIDNDCNGTIDDQDAVGCKRYYMDGDQDGYGKGDDYRCLCAPDLATGYLTLKPGDCNDADPALHPGVIDPCGDGKDSNCDGIDSCTSVRGVIKDPNAPDLNIFTRGMRMDLMIWPGGDVAATLDDPNDHVQLQYDPHTNSYYFIFQGINPGIYELHVKNVDVNPAKWAYQPYKKTVTLKQGVNRQDISLVSISEPPRIASVVVTTKANSLKLTLKEIFWEDGQQTEKLLQKESLSKLDPNLPFYHEFQIFKDSNCRIYGQAQGYRSVKETFHADAVVTIPLYIDSPSTPSVSVNKQDIADAVMSLTFSYRHPTGVQGEWVDADHNPLMSLDLRFYAPVDDADKDGIPDNMGNPPSGPHITQDDMAKAGDLKDLNSITRLIYSVDAAADHMTFIKGSGSDPNNYIVSFQLRLIQAGSGQVLIGPVYRGFTITQEIPPIDQRTVAEVVDTILGTEIFSKGIIPIEGEVQINGQARPIGVGLDASAIDPAFLIQVDSDGKAENAADPNSPLELKTEYAPDPDDPNVIVVRLEMRGANGEQVEYNPERNPDAPPIVLDIPLSSALQPPVEFSEAISKAVIKFERFGRIENFRPEDGEGIEFYISGDGVFMARVLTRHTSEWSTGEDEEPPLSVVKYTRDGIDAEGGGYFYDPDARGITITLEATDADTAVKGIWYAVSQNPAAPDPGIAANYNEYLGPFQLNQPNQVNQGGYVHFYSEDTAGNREIVNTVQYVFGPITQNTVMDGDAQGFGVIDPNNPVVVKDNATLTIKGHMTASLIELQGGGDLNVEDGAVLTVTATLFAPMEEGSIVSLGLQGTGQIVSPALVVDFSIQPDPPTVNVNEPLQFLEHCTGYIKKWAWTFGDGGSSTGRIVGHAYANPDEYRVTLTVTPGDGTAQKSIQRGVWIVGETTYTTDQLHSGVELTDYRAITFPVDPDDPNAAASNNFYDDLGENYKKEWRLFAWDADTALDLGPSDPNRYEEFPTIGKLKPGKAFFLITKKSNVIIDIPGRPLMDAYSIMLETGWNLIGNPYPFPVSWQAVLNDPNNAAAARQLYLGADPLSQALDIRDIPKLYEFDPNRSATDYYIYEVYVMREGKGYWLKNTGVRTRLNFQPLPYNEPLTMTRYRAEGSAADLPPAIPRGTGEAGSEEKGGGCFVTLLNGDSGFAAGSPLPILFFSVSAFLLICLIGLKIFKCKKRACTSLVILLGISLCIFRANPCVAVEGQEASTYLEAKAALQEGRYEVAEGGFRKVLSIYPEHAEAQRDLGLTLIFLKREGDAFKALRKASDLAPKTVLSLEARQAAGFLYLKKRSPLTHSLYTGYIYDDNVVLYTYLDEEQGTATGRYDSIGMVRYSPQLNWYLPGLKGLNTLGLAYMIDSRFYDQMEDKTLQIHLLMATWKYVRGLSRLTFLANYHTSVLDYDRYTYGPGIGVKWAHDFSYRMMVELGGRYDWQTRSDDRTNDKDVLNSTAKLRLYSENRKGFIDVLYAFKSDHETSGLKAEEKADLTLGQTNKFEVSCTIPGSFVLPFGFLFPHEDWSAHRDSHAISFSTKRFQWYKYDILDGNKREDKLFEYEYKHTQRLFRKSMGSRTFLIDLELKYTYKVNDSNLNDITLTLGPEDQDRDYHRNIYALGLNLKF